MAVFNAKTTEKENVVEVEEVKEETVFDPDDGNEVDSEELIARINEMQDFMSKALSSDITSEELTKMIKGAREKHLASNLMNIEYKQDLLKKDLDEKSYNNSLIIDEIYSIIQSIIDTEFDNDLEMYLVIISCCRWTFWFANEGSVLDNAEDLKATSTIGITEALATVYLAAYKDDREDDFIKFCNIIAKGDAILAKVYVGGAKCLAEDEKYDISNIFEQTINKAKDVIINATGLPGSLFKIVQA